MIKDTLRNAISSLSKKHGIQERDLRIRISKSDDKLKYEIMDKKDVLEETNVATALNLNSITAFMVGNRINTIVDSLSREFHIPESTLNVRIYTRTEDCEPLLYLFDEKNPKQQLDIDRLV